MYLVLYDFADDSSLPIGLFLTLGLAENVANRVKGSIYNKEVGVEGAVLLKSKPSKWTVKFTAENHERLIAKDIAESEIAQTMEVFRLANYPHTELKIGSGWHSTLYESRIVNDVQVGGFSAGHFRAEVSIYKWENVDAQVS